MLTCYFWAKNGLLGQQQYAQFRSGWGTCTYKICGASAAWWYMACSKKSSKTREVSLFPLFVLTLLLHLGQSKHVSSRRKKKKKKNKHTERLESNSHLLTSFLWE